MTSTGNLIARALGAAGLDAVYGEPLPGLSVITAAPRVATLLARAHERVHGERAAVHSGGGTLRLGGTGPWTPVSISDLEDLAENRERLASGPLELRLDLDLEAPVDRRVGDELASGGSPVPDRWTEPAADIVDALATADAPVVLAGPGVATPRAVAGLHALAVAGSFGVLNTWGAKGVFHWQSRHHWATVGLQARDFELGGLADTDLIVATGIDAREAPTERWQLGPALTVEPQALDPLAEALRRPWRALEMPPLRARVGAVTQAGWAESVSPLAPSRVTLNYGQAVGGGGVMAADPGMAGFWVARTFGTTDLRSVHVPAESDALGFAPACVTVARLRRPGRPALAVVDGPVLEIVHEVIAAARRLGVAVPVEVWSPDGDRLDADDHLARARRMAHGAETSVAALEVDDRQLSAMVDAAGPIIAWQPPNAGCGQGW